jgi:hypothetical protein
LGVYVVRAVVQLRELLEDPNTCLARKLNNHDEVIGAILSTIRELMNPPVPRRRGIGLRNLDQIAGASLSCHPTIVRQNCQQSDSRSKLIEPHSSADELSLLIDRR